MTTCEHSLVFVSFPTPYYKKGWCGTRRDRRSPWHCSTTSPLQNNDNVTIPSHGSPHWGAGDPPVGASPQWWCWRHGWWWSKISDDDNNDQVFCDSVGGPCGPKGSTGDCGPEGSQGPLGPVAPVFMDLYVKCSNHFSKGWWRWWKSPLWSYDWMNSQGTAESAKCGRFYLTLVGDANLFIWISNPCAQWLEPSTRMFSRQFSELGHTQTRRTNPQMEFLPAWWINWHNSSICSKVKTVCQKVRVQWRSSLRKLEECLDIKILLTVL